MLLASPATCNAARVTSQYGPAGRPSGRRAHSPGGGPGVLSAPCSAGSRRLRRARTPESGIGADRPSAATPRGEVMGNSISLSRHHFLHADIRRVPALQSLEWLKRGWDDFEHTRAASLAHGALITALGAVLLMLGSSHPYLVAAAVSGYLLVGPIMTTGLCELSRRRAAQEAQGFDESLQGMTRNPEGLLYFGAVLAAIAVI